MDVEIYLLPLDGEPKRTPNMGIGTGTWTTDIADRFPGSEVIGTDLSPIQPDWMPPNLRFYGDDVEGGWT